MIPSQVIRALGQAARLLGLEERHRAAVELEESATREDVVELLDAMAEQLASSGDLPGSGRIRRVLELAAQGLHDPAIAERLGMTAMSVREIRRDAGVPGRPRPRERTGWQDRIRDLHEQGQTTAEIAEALGYTVRTVQQRLHELGLRAHR